MLARVHSGQSGAIHGSDLILDTLNSMRFSRGSLGVGKQICFLASFDFYASTLITSIFTPGVGCCT